MYMVYAFVCAVAMWLQAQEQLSQLHFFALVQVFAWCTLLQLPDCPVLEMMPELVCHNIVPGCRSAIFGAFAIGGSFIWTARFFRVTANCLALVVDFNAVKNLQSLVFMTFP